MTRSDRRVILDEIGANLDVFHGTVYKITHLKLHFSDVSWPWVLKMLTDNHKMQRLIDSRPSLHKCLKKGEALLSRIVTTDETCIFHYEPESKRQLMQWKHASFPVKKKCKYQKYFGNVMLTVFWDRNKPITITSLKRGNTLNSENYCELLSEVKKDIERKRRGYN